MLIPKSYEEATRFSENPTKVQRTIQFIIIEKKNIKNLSNTQA